MRDFNFLLKIFNFDSISKFNLMFIKNLNFSLKFFILINLKLSDSKFLLNFLYISQIVFFWFNKRIAIVKCFNDKKVDDFSNRNNLILMVGLLFRDKNKIVKSLWFIFNIIKNISKTIDDNFNFKMSSFYFNYFFDNINYLLGLPDLGRFYVWKNNINVVIYLQKNINKLIFNFYEKLFY